jgi:hypothetical protein
LRKPISWGQAIIILIILITLIVLGPWLLPHLLQLWQIISKAAGDNPGKFTVMTLDVAAAWTSRKMKHA